MERWLPYIWSHSLSIVRNIPSNQFILNDIPPVNFAHCFKLYLTADLKAVQHKQMKRYNQGLLLFKENHKKS